MILHELRNLLQEEPEAANAPAVQHNALPERRVTVLHQNHPLVPAVMDVPVVIWMLLGPGGSPEDILVRVMVVIRAVSVTERSLQGLSVPVLAAEVALLQGARVGHHAMVGDPGQAAAVFEGQGRLVGAVISQSVEALEVSLVG